MSEDKDLLKRVEAALDTVRPHLQVDGGNVEVVEITDDNRVLIKWIGTCESCSMSAMTMRAGIAQAIQTNVPSIIGVEALNGVKFS